MRTHMSRVGAVIVLESPGGSNGKESTCNAGDLGSIPGSGRSPRGGNGNPLQYSCLEDSMDRGAWQTAVHRIAKSQTRLGDYTFTLLCIKYYKSSIDDLKCMGECV